MKKPKTKTQLKREADRLFSLLIRASGDCAARNRSCKGRLQCAHIVSRRYLNVRWDPDNAVPLCQGHHFGWTNHPLEWDQWVEDQFPGRLAHLRRKALEDHPKPDYPAIIADLTERLKGAHV